MTDQKLTHKMNDTLNEECSKWYALVDTMWKYLWNSAFECNDILPEGELDSTESFHLDFLFFWN